MANYDVQIKNGVTHFYLPTSSEIIQEAKAAIKYKPSMNTKIVKTKRPFTPLNQNRILFGFRTGERPPSSINCRNIGFQVNEIDDDVRYDKNENKIIELNGFLAPKVQLPSINHKSTSSLDKVTERIQREWKIDKREIHSSPALGESEFGYSTVFPRIKTSPNKSQKLLPMLCSSEKNHRPPIKVTKAWLEPDTINKIDEQDSVQGILSMICKAISDGYEDDEMISFTDQLQITMEVEGLTKPNQKNNFIKNLILKTMFELIDSPNNMLVAYVTQIILTLRVTGANLTAVCKIVFKMARHDRNDYLFQQRCIIAPFVDCLGLATPEDDNEALIYGYGALKFLTMNAELLNQMLDFGILQLMTLHLKMINSAKTEDSFLSEQNNHILFQLTGCLRNIANDDITHDDFSRSGMLTEIFITVQLFHDDTNLVLNISRIISVLSMNESCCDVISDIINLKTIVRTLEKYPSRSDIVVRLAYGLGNVLTFREDSRYALIKHVSYVLDVICKLINTYLVIELNGSSDANKNELNSSVLDDVLVKLIRVVANMSIEPKVGASLVCIVNNDEKCATIVKKAGEFLDILITILKTKTVENNEELVISTLCTLNNLSYYSHPQINGPFQQRYIDISEALHSFLNTDHIDLKIEIARVYGNLTRSAIISNCILETGGFSYIISWLDSVNRDLLCATTGILVNMIVDQNAQHIFKHTNGIIKLIKILEKNAEHDWQLAALVCQVIWNFIIDANRNHFSFDSDIGQKLLAILIDLLDEDRLFGENKIIFGNFDYKLWEDFSTVATNILEKSDLLGK